MAQYQQIEFIIDRFGNIVERVLNGQGPNCLDWTADLEAELGTVEQRQLLPEYHQQPVALYEETLQQNVQGQS